MKEKFEKIKKTILASKKKAPVEALDEAYLQINKTSFQQNFKVLLGHYK